MSFYDNSPSPYYDPFNKQMGNTKTQFQMGNVLMNIPYTDSLYQENNSFKGNRYLVGMRDIFDADINSPECGADNGPEPVGKLFFSENNVKRIQKIIKRAIYIKTRGAFVLTEDQDDTDLLVVMRATYMEHGRFLPQNIPQQVDELNKKLVRGIIPNMITEIRQGYGYLKEINEPLKPIDRPMNVSVAGRRTIPSITTVWTR